MNEETIERLAAAFDTIASALEGLHEEAKRAGKRYWPEPGQQKEVVVSRVPTEEDKIRERQGAGDTIPINQWLDDLGDPEGEDIRIIGERSREWITNHENDNKTKIEEKSDDSNSIKNSNDKNTETNL